jgi:stress-induced-phosphoprotein 1
MKLMQWGLALEDCDKCLSLDPKFIKSYVRKCKIQLFLKQFHKALETVNHGLALEPANSELKELKMEVMVAIQASACGGAWLAATAIDGSACVRARVCVVQQSNASGEADPQRVEEAMKDPEIQAILQDPVIQQVLKDFKESPAAAQRALKDASVRARLEKLVAAGIVRMA